MAYKGQEKRQYIRLNSCFPVEFSLIFSNKPHEPVKKYQAFTHDISKGGLCLNVRGLDQEDEEFIKNKQVKLDLSINIFTPFFKKPIYAECDIAWLKKFYHDSEGILHTIGLSYSRISEKERKKIFNYAFRMKWIPRLKAAVILFLLVTLLFNYYQGQKTRRQNEVLVSRLVEFSERRNDIFKQLNILNQEKLFLEKKYQRSAEQIKNIQASVDAQSEAVKSDSVKTLTDLNAQIEALKTENAQLVNKITSITQQEQTLQKNLITLEYGSIALEKANIEKMKKWVLTHRNKKTGLVLSYEGDREYEDWSFTYDQALAAQMFLLFNDKDKADAILNFYKLKADKENSLFYNAYDAQSGRPVEYSIHSGPNLWIGISACVFTYKTKETRYLGMAENIAASMISMIEKSKDNSIKGGPSVSWVSTEHNMDAYAFFIMLHKITEKEKYKQAAQKLLIWLKDSAYNKPQGRFNRGRGDATIATDTFSWAIAALTPEVIFQNSMDPDAVMEFAEENCLVETSFYRPDGAAINVTGFDFSKPSNIGRGGVVSCEWTAQMIVAFKMMSNYHQKKSNTEKSVYYAKKAEYYLTQLGKMVISSPSPSGQGEGCLPYASVDNVDTGHGWRVAKGRRTGSVAATIYYLFAQHGYNPLRL